MSRGLPAKKSVPLDEWRKKIAAVHVSKDDMNYLIMNYLVVEGYAEAAKAFQEESGTEPGVDFEALAERNAIRKAVQAGSIEEAIERVNDLNPEILEERQQLSFHLQQQRLIELIRRGAVEEALEFCAGVPGAAGGGKPAVPGGTREDARAAGVRGRGGESAGGPAGSVAQAEHSERAQRSYPEHAEPGPGAAAAAAHQDDELGGGTAG